MFDSIIRVIAKVCGVSGGLALIGLTIMWFGAVPMVACIFGDVSGGFLFGMMALMIVVIVLIVKFIIAR